MANADNKDSSFKLPGSSLEEVFKVVQGYANLSVVRVIWRTERFLLTEALVHHCVHFRRQFSGAARGVSGLSVS